MAKIVKVKAKLNSQMDDISDALIMSYGTVLDVNNLLDEVTNDCLTKKKSMSKKELPQ